MNIDELEKLAREAHDPGFPWVDRDALIGGLFAKGEIDYIAAAKPAAILELIERVRELEAAPTQPAQPSGNPGELPEPSDAEKARISALESAAEAIEREGEGWGEDSKYRPHYSDMAAIVRAMKYQGQS